MKQRWFFGFVAVLIFAAQLPLFAADENVAVWEQTYRSSQTDDERTAVLLRIMEFGNKDYIPLLQEALSKLTERKIEFGSPSEQFAKLGLGKLLVQALGDLKALESAELVFRTYREVQDGLVKAEAAFSLGKMRATTYAEQLARDLADLNLKPNPETARSQETIAYGIIQGLNAMRATIGYEAVFMASTGWYSTASKVKDVAKTSLDSMLDDPTEGLTKILRENPSLGVKFAALEAEERSKASVTRKTQTAQMALKMGIGIVPTDTVKNVDIVKFRKRAVAMLVNLHDNDPASAQLYKEAIGLDKNNDETFDETLQAYTALGANGSDAAANFMVTRMELYERERSKANTARDKSLVRELISAMKRSKNALVKPVLNRSQFIESYDAQIIREIKAALKEL